MQGFWGCKQGEYSVLEFNLYILKEYSFLNDGLLAMVWLVQSWLSLSSKCKNPIVVLATRPDVSAGLQSNLES